MKIAVLANDHQWEEINTTGEKVVYYRILSAENFAIDTAACLLLEERLNADFYPTNMPIFINSVCTTLKEIDAAPNVIRINGWNGFLARNTWEVAGNINNPVQELMEAMGKKTVVVPDEPGFVSARIIAMIINEAYFALQDKVSTIEHMDIALKLGTNHPYGPFEWSSLIGVENIFTLLQKMSTKDNRYLPAPLLKAAISA